MTNHTNDKTFDAVMLAAFRAGSAAAGRTDDSDIDVAYRQWRAEQAPRNDPPAT